MCRKGRGINASERHPRHYHANTLQKELQVSYCMSVTRPTCSPGGCSQSVCSTAASKQASRRVRPKVSLEIKLHVSLYNGGHFGLFMLSDFFNFYNLYVSSQRKKKYLATVFMLYDVRNCGKLMMNMKLVIQTVFVGLMKKRKRCDCD